MCVVYDAPLTAGCPIVVSCPPSFARIHMAAPLLKMCSKATCTQATQTFASIGTLGAYFVRSLYVLSLVPCLLLFTFVSSATPMGVLVTIVELLPLVCVCVCVCVQPPWWLRRIQVRHPWV